MKVSFHYPHRNERIEFSWRPQWIVPAHFGRRKVLGVWFHRWQDVTFRWLGVDLSFHLPSHRRLPQWFLNFD
jgi:hypothetical protein